MINIQKCEYSSTEHYFLRIFFAREMKVTKGILFLLMLFVHEQVIRTLSSRLISFLCCPLAITSTAVVVLTRLKKWEQLPIVVWPSEHTQPVDSLLRNPLTTVGCTRYQYFVLLSNKTRSPFQKHLLDPTFSIFFFSNFYFIHFTPYAFIYCKTFFFFNTLINF